MPAPPTSHPTRTQAGLALRRSVEPSDWSRGVQRARGHAGASRGGRECAASKRGARVRRLHATPVTVTLVFCFLCDVWEERRGENERTQLKPALAEHEDIAGVR